MSLYHIKGQLHPWVSFIKSIWLSFIEKQNDENAQNENTRIENFVIYLI